MSATYPYSGHRINGIHGDHRMLITCSGHRVVRYGMKIPGCNRLFPLSLSALALALVGLLPTLALALPQTLRPAPLSASPAANGLHQLQAQQQRSQQQQLSQRYQLESRQLQFRQQVDQQQLSRQLQQNALQQQMNQQSLQRLQNNQASQRQLQQAGAASRSTYEANQRALLQRYQSQQAVQSAVPVRPLPPRRGGGPR